MATTNFVDGVTKIQAHWLNDVNRLLYETFGGATTGAQVRQAISAVSSAGDSVTGDYDITGTLDVSSDVHIGGDLTVDGTINIADLEIDADQVNFNNAGTNIQATDVQAAVVELNDEKLRNRTDTLTGDLTVTGNLDVGGHLDFGTIDLVATDVDYNNTNSGLAAVEVQTAIDEVVSTHLKNTTDTLTGNLSVTNNLDVGGHLNFGTIDIDAIEVKYDNQGTDIETENVQDAISELDREKLKNTTDTLTGDLTVTGDVHIGGELDFGSIVIDADEVKYDPTGSGLVSTDVQGAIDEIVVQAGVLSFNGRTGTVLPQAGDYDKSMVGLGNVNNWFSSSQSDAEGGTNNTSYMTPLRTHQSFNQYGLGNSNTVLPTLAANDVTETRWFRIAPDDPNNPSPGNGLTCLHIKHSAGAFYQTAYRYNPGMSSWSRNMSGGSTEWSDWVQNFNEGNLLNIGTTPGSARSALLLGNAATHNYATLGEAQTGTSQTTIMNPLRTHQAFNQYGIGAVTLEVPGGDIGVTDNSIPSGLYRISNATVGAPFTWGSLIHMRRSGSGGEVQIAVEEASQQMMIRARGAGNWSPWRTSWDSFNQLALGATPASARTALQLGALAQGDDASDVSYNNSTSGLGSTDVQGAIDELAATTGGVVSFNGRTGVVTPQSGDYTKAQVGLGNVDNTSDANKPISTATQSALDGKVNSIGGTIDGYGPNTSSNGPDWGANWPVVRSNGATEVGRYIDFHPVSGDTSDYSVRLDGGGAGSNTLTITGNLNTAGSLTAVGNISSSGVIFGDARRTRVGAQVTVSTSGNFVADHQGRVVYVTAAGVTLTIPQGVFPNGSVIFIVTNQEAANTPTIAAGAGVVISKPPSKALRPREPWSMIGIVNRSNDNWTAFGDLADA